MSITENIAYTSQGIARLLEQYKGAPRMVALISAFLDEIQELESTGLWPVFIDRVLSSDLAVGDLLVKLGKIVGQTSEGLDDDAFRLLITARIRANRSNGKHADLVAVASILVPDTTIYAKDFPPAAVYISPLGPVTVDPYVIALKFLAHAAAGGVMLIFVWTEADWDSTLVFGSVYSPGFAISSNVPTNTGVSAGQMPGSVYHSGFTNGPPPTNDGGGVLAGVIQTRARET